MQAANVSELSMTDDEVSKKVIARDNIDEDTGEVLFPVNTELQKPVLEQIKLKNISQFEVLFIDEVNVDSSFRDTLNADKTANQEEALIEIYKRMRPGDPPTLDNASQLFDNLFSSKNVTTCPELVV